ncbi:hypothetical protein [Streptococcus loxodontisalivarius]|uniref:Uncharacterized protein n=1 Tax=Streptococcus loxodontisalivarius TaxID=1349415 RepID=A0ABS2PQ70_9STRE|nr:hypothetical protein [Streptococcus loxodontisalivarius]MBM7642021.1 hypothetical protein [Streptococcus loxodontisalivarius]
MKEFLSFMSLRIIFFLLDFIVLCKILTSKVDNESKIILVIIFMLSIAFLLGTFVVRKYKFTSTVRFWSKMLLLLYTFLVILSHFITIVFFSVFITNNEFMVLILVLLAVIDMYRVLLGNIIYYLILFIFIVSQTSFGGSIINWTVITLIITTVLLPLFEKDLIKLYSKVNQVSIKEIDCDIEYDLKEKKIQFLLALVPLYFGLKIFDILKDIIFINSSFEKTANEFSYFLIVENFMKLFTVMLLLSLYYACFDLIFSKILSVIFGKALIKPTEKRKQKPKYLQMKKIKYLQM